MNASLVLLAGIAIFFNFAIILWKFKAGRYLDMFIDGLTLTAISYLTMGSVTGFVAGMIGSALMSVYLLVANPMADFSFDDDDEYYEETQASHA